MGLLSSIGAGLKKVKEVVTTVTPLTAIQNIAAGKPITNTEGVGLKRTVEVVGTILNPFDNTRLTFDAPKPVKKVAEAALNNPYVTALGVGAVGAAIAAPAAAATAAKALIPASTGGKIAAVVAAPAVAGAFVRQPGAALDAVSNAPSALANFGGNVADLAVNPSLDNLVKVGKENPVITGALVGGAVLAGGAKLLPAIATTRQTEAIQEQTEALKGIGGLPSDSVSALPYSPPSALPSAAPSSKVPLTPQTQEVRATTSRKRRKGTQIKKTPSVVQRVTVNLQNKTLKIGKYLNSRRLLA